MNYFYAACGDVHFHKFASVRKYDQREDRDILPQKFFEILYVTFILHDRIIEILLGKAISDNPCKNAVLPKIPQKEQRCLLRRYCYDKKSQTHKKYEKENLE